MFHAQVPIKTRANFDIRALLIARPVIADRSIAGALSSRIDHLRSNKAK